MIFFLLGQDNADETLLRTYESITRYLETHGITLISSYTLDQSSYQKLVPNGLTNVSAFIIEQSAHHRETAYILNFASQSKKPLLYLSLRYSKSNEFAFHLKHNRGEKMFVKYYDSINMNKILKWFIEKIQKNLRAPKRSIKFTLRLNQDEHDYLLWKCHTQKQGKAQFLRDNLLKTLIEQDEVYQRLKAHRQ